MKYLYLAAIILFGSISSLMGDVDTAWVRMYDGNLAGTDRATAITVDDLGNVYVTGYTNGYGITEDIATVKYDPDGDTVWVRTYNGPGDRYDNGKDVYVDDSGYVYVAGDVWGETYNEDLAVIKYDSSGNLIWVRVYDGPGHGEDHVGGLAVDKSYNVYIFGDSDGGAEDDDFVTIKYTPVGDTAWIVRYDGPLDQEERAQAIAVDDSGNVYVAGISDRSGSGGDYTTIRYDKNGIQKWINWYTSPGGQLDSPSDIALDHLGNVIVTGYISPGGYLDKDFATVKYDSSGTKLWAKEYNGIEGVNDQAAALTVDNAGNIYVTGFCDYSMDYPYVYPDYCTIKYLPEGDTAWVRRYNGPDDLYDAACAIDIDSEGNIYITGTSEGDYYGTKYDYATLKYDSDGDELWSIRFNSSDSLSENARDICVGQGGSVYVTGYCQTQLSEDYLTIKYESTYICGDANSDETVNVSDAVWIINYVFLGGDPPDPIETGDPNCDDDCNVSDAVWIVNYVFINGNAPCDTDGDDIPDC